MSYTQFGYSTYATSSPFVVGTGPSSTPQGSSSTSSSASYERSCGTPDATAVAATTYDARLLSSRLAAVSTGLYGGSTGGYPAAAAPVVDQTVTASPYPSLEPTSPFYPALNTAYAMKETADPWRTIPQSAPYYYDPTLAAYGYSGLDFNGARRKNVTRDSTSTLKAWLNEHRKNPYPTKGEKIMLAIITKMTLTQVSTWFANARRRLKKENKMTWEPRNKSESQPEDEGGKKSSLAEEDEDEEDEDEDMNDGNVRDKQSENFDRTPTSVKFSGSDLASRNPTGVLDRTTDFPSALEGHRNDVTFSHHPLQQHHHQRDLCRPTRAPCLIGRQQHHVPNFDATSEGGRCSAVSSSPELSAVHPVDHHSHHRGYGDPGIRHDLLSSLDDSSSQKPKIWSLADTATNKAVQNSLFGGYHHHQAPTASINSVAEWPSAAVPTNDSLIGQSCYGSGSFTSFVPSGPTQVQSPGSSYGYGHPHGGFVSLQTDTPPQTPPNMKVSSGALQQVSSSTLPSLSAPSLPSSHPPPNTTIPNSPSSSTPICNLPNTSASPVTSSLTYAEAQDQQQHSNAVYLGPSHQQSGICDPNAHHFDDSQDKQCDGFSATSLGHLSTQASLMSPRTGQCVRDDFAAHLQFRDPPVH